MVFLISTTNIDIFTAFNNYSALKAIRQAARTV
jgi:hypothetical protein